MNLKTELKNLGYYLITPIPAKYHFEGVDNRRAAIQLLVVSVALPAVIFGVVAAVAKVRDEIEDHKSFRKGVREIDEILKK
jgi:hypothetical protein